MTASPEGPSQTRRIERTDHDAVHPWPAGTYLQGGNTGLVFRQDGTTYRTAFVEAFVDDTFIRGEGETVTEAEAQAWVKFSRYRACPGHDYETRGYTNGAGFCRHCGKFASDVFTAEDLGQYCITCGTATMWSRAGNHWYCQDHALPREERWAANAAANVRLGPLETILESLTNVKDDV
jgi:hypothetical protein